MAALAFWLALRYRNFREYNLYTMYFLFTFFLVSLLYNHYVFHSDIDVFEDADFDISYFTLMMPYCLFSIVWEQSQKRPISQRFIRWRKFLLHK